MPVTGDIILDKTDYHFPKHIAVFRLSASLFRLEALHLGILKPEMTALLFQCSLRKNNKTCHMGTI